MHAKKMEGRQAENIGGLVTLALALLLPWSFLYWLKTRAFEPVDKPASLERKGTQRRFRA
jgi:hypothetical protein